jgi:hypothetical protein
VTRFNAKAEWIVQDVPELRIVTQQLWDSVKERQRRRQQDVRDEGRQLRLNAAHRPHYLFSGLLKCGICGGAYTIIDSKRYACANHRNRGTCANAVRVPRLLIEKRILDGLKDRLLTPELFQAFAHEYVDFMNRRARVEAASDTSARQQLSAVNSKIEAVLAAIEDGIRTPSTKRRLEELETRREQLEANLSKPQPGRSKVRLHPRLAELYREKVADLQEALNDVEERGEAAEIMRSLIDKVVLTPEMSDRMVNAKLYGALAGILALAGGESCTGPGRPMQLSLVAEERSQLYSHLVNARVPYLRSQAAPS